MADQTFIGRNGVVANDTAKVQWVAGDITAQSWSYIFNYRII